MGILRMSCGVQAPTAPSQCITVAARLVKDPLIPVKGILDSRIVELRAGELI